MKKIIYITVALLFVTCTKDMTEVTDVSNVDGSNSAVLISTSSKPMAHYMFSGLHEFENERLLLTTKESGQYCYIDMRLNGKVEVHNTRADVNRGKLATKDYFIIMGKSKNELVLMDKNNQKVSNFFAHDMLLEMYYAQNCIAQYESNTFYKPPGSGKSSSLVNGKDFYINTTLDGDGQGFLNKDHLFTINSEFQPNNSSYINIYLNKYTHSLQPVQRTLLESTKKTGGQNPPLQSSYWILPNNHYDKLIISNSIPANNNGLVSTWNILNNNLQLIGSFQYPVHRIGSAREKWVHHNFVSRRGEIVVLHEALASDQVTPTFEVYDINSGVTKTYNIHDEFGIPSTTSNVGILMISERRAGGFYVLYQQAESGGYSAYLRVLNK